LFFHEALYFFRLAASWRLAGESQGEFIISKSFRGFKPPKDWIRTLPRRRFYTPMAAGKIS